MAGQSYQFRFVESNNLKRVVQPKLILELPQLNLLKYMNYSWNILDLKDFTVVPFGD